MNHTKLLAAARKWGFSYRKLSKPTNDNRGETWFLEFYHPRMKMQPVFYKPEMVRHIKRLEAGESFLVECVHCKHIFILNEFQVSKAFPKGHCAGCWRDLHPLDDSFQSWTGSSPFNTPHSVWMPWTGVKYTGTQIARRPCG